MERLWLKDIRRKENISTYKVAKELGISQSQYSAIENGSRRPSPERAMAIANYFGFAWTRFYKEDK